MPDLKSPKGSLARLTALCLGGLVLGVAGGILLREVSPAASSQGLSLATAIIRAWTNAFRLLVLPLVASQLYLAIATANVPKAGFGRLVLAAPVIFASLLIFTAGLSFLLTSQFLALPWLAGLSISGMPSSSTLLPQDLPGDAVVGGWVDRLVPPNLVSVAATDNILPVMLFVVAFAIAARRLSTEQRGPLDRALGAVNQVTFTMVDWLLLATPLVVLALGFQAGHTTGAKVGSLLLGYVGLESTVLVLVTLALLPMAAIGGHLGLGTLIRAMAPAQLAAAVTRSSLATIPSLLTAARQLGLPSLVSDAMIPLAGATLKLSRAASRPAALLFLAHVLGLSLQVQQILVFIATELLLSPAGVGVPRVISDSRDLPAFAAAGIPVEYVILLGTTDWIVDVFKTVLNTTGYQTANVLIARFSGWIAPPAVPALGDSRRIAVPDSESEPGPPEAQEGLTEAA
jgi:proton glutamate symport protein